MSSPKAEIALARLVASLAKTSEEDIEAVLSRLDRAERDALRPLFEKIGCTVRIEAPEPPRQPERKPDIVPPGVSPWLAARMSDERAKSADGEALRITQAARQALRAIASEKESEPASRETSSGWGIFRRAKRSNQEEARS